MMKKQIKADFMLLFITVVWGSSFPLMKIVLNYMSAFAYLSLRFAMAAVLLVLIYCRNFKRFSKKTLLYGCVIGVFMFGGMAFQVFGLYTTSASNSGFITGLNVVMVPVISSILLKKKPDRASVIGVIIAFAGLFFMSGGLTFDFTIGDLLTFLCAICWAFQIIFIDKFISAGEDASLLAIMQVSFTAIASTILWLTVDFKPVIFHTTPVGILLITGVMGTALAFGGQTIAQKYTSPTHTALILNAEPVFALVFAMIIPSAAGGGTDSFTLIKAIGCLLILGGMLISEFKLKTEFRIE